MENKSAVLESAAIASISSSAWAISNLRRLAGEAAVCQRFRRAKAEGDLPTDSNPVDLARYVVTIAQGMAVQTAGGASCEGLQRVVRTAIRAWPR